MENQMQVFQSEEFGKVRVVQKDGQPWWVLKDVCTALGITNPSKVAQRLDEDERMKVDPNLELGSRSNTPVIVVSESGLYAVILRSDKPNAKTFRRWAFTYKTVAFTWAKRCKKSPGWFVGLGYWTRANAEICLLATRGSPKRVSKSVRQIIDTPIERHSKKPDEARTRIVELMGDVPRIELFAREKAEGWDVFGNEVESDIILQSKGG